MSELNYRVDPGRNDFALKENRKKIKREAGGQICRLFLFFCFTRV